MELVALYKIFEGHEFIEASIESIYDHVEKLIFVSSDLSWSGEQGNTVENVVKRWKIKNDKKDKITILKGSWSSQELQYNYGLSYIKNNYPNIPYILIIDSDEIYEKKDLEKLNNKLDADNCQHDAFTCKMVTYIKSVYYKIDPIEPCCPTIIIKNNLSYFSGVRGSGVQNRKHLDDVFFHHFCYVRDSEETIKRKFINSQLGDKTPSISWNDWYENKWKKLPDTINFHPTKDREENWHRIIKISEDDLPEAVKRKLHDKQ